METMEAVELEKQKHNNTRMEVLARLAKLEVITTSFYTASFMLVLRSLRFPFIPSTPPFLLDLLVIFYILKLLLKVRSGFRLQMLTLQDRLRQCSGILKWRYDSA